MSARRAAPLNSWDILKIVALLLMFIDHAGAFFYQDQYWLRSIGRGAMPIFLFLTGYASNYRFNRELLVLAILMGVSDFLLAGHLRTQNILVTIILCRLIFGWLEKHEKRIDRPHEWFIGSLALFTTSFISQYGSFGFMFALSGYLMRRKEQYPRSTPQVMLAASLLVTGAYYYFFSEPRPNFPVMLVTLVGVYCLLSRFELRPVQAAMPRRLAQGLKWFSYYSGYIYALHLIALEWITGIPF